MGRDLGQLTDSAVVRAPRGSCLFLRVPSRSVAEIDIDTGNDYMYVPLTSLVYKHI